MALAYSVLLRRELGARNQDYATAKKLIHQLSYGEDPVVVYAPEDSGHGNFLPETYAAILANEGWRRRLSKVHTQARSALPKAERRWCELDSSCSSDALLMNVFCHPDVFTDGRVLSLLGVDANAGEPEFGFRARVPLMEGKFDRTEVDMRLGSLLVEAKLTESDFQTRARAGVEQYRDFRKIFNRRELPRCGDNYLGYQLIRNVLAAHALQSSFCVLADARRPDLREQWFAVMRAVKPVALRLRCQMLTWQELAHALPERLQEFLAEKYGIVAQAC